MRVTRKHVISQRARGLRQNHRESNECDRLPKLRRFKPDEQPKERGTRNGKQPANGALPGIIAQSCQSRGEIEHRAENGESEQTHSNVSVFGGFEVQIEDRCAIESECAQERYCP